MIRSTATKRQMPTVSLNGREFATHATVSTSQFLVGMDGL